MTDPPLDPREARAAFERLYADTYRKVLVYARRRTTSYADADDVVAATFLVAWQRLEEALGAEHPLAWLYGVAYRVHANQRRSAARKARLRRRAAEEMAKSDQDVAPVVAETNETLGLVLGALGTLSRADQEILRLAAFEQLSHPEIAEMLDIRAGLVRSRLFRARRRLQGTYERLCSGDG
ncbi:MAG: sigma-70 family RNA polymerase sigma factor [Actinobacteria bacterium]|nr:sigma-70 family RNA polymerase sigma factor [Actinomycetota bacterium]